MAGIEFDIEGALKAGATHADIADFLASKSDFDLAGAREAGATDTDVITFLATPPRAPTPAQKDDGIMAAGVRGLKNTFDFSRLAVASPEDAAGIISEVAARQVAPNATQQKMQADIAPAIQEAVDADGVMDTGWAYAKLYAKRAAQLMSNPREFAKMTAENMPNSAPGMAGTIAGSLMGAATPIPGGSIAGGVVGGTAGGFAIERGSSIFEQVMKEAQARGVDPKDPNALAPIIQEKYDEISTAGNWKGVGTAGTDAILTRLTFGIGSLGTKPLIAEAAAIRKGVTEGTLSVADATARTAALEAAAAARNTLGQKSLRGGGMVVGEMAGESTSEAVGQKLAYGHVDPGDVVDEGLLAFGQGAVMAGAGKAMRPLLGQPRDPVADAVSSVRTTIADITKPDATLDQSIAAAAAVVDGAGDPIGAAIAGVADQRTQLAEGDAALALGDTDQPVSPPVTLSGADAAAIQRENALGLMTPRNGTGIDIGTEIGAAPPAAQSFIIPEPVRGPVWLTEMAKLAEMDDAYLARLNLSPEQQTAIAAARSAPSGNTLEIPTLAKTAGGQAEIERAKLAERSIATVRAEEAAQAELAAQPAQPTGMPPTTAPAAPSTALVPATTYAVGPDGVAAPVPSQPVTAAKGNETTTVPSQVSVRYEQNPSGTQILTLTPKGVENLDAIRATLTAAGIKTAASKRTESGVVLQVSKKTDAAAVRNAIQAINAQYSTGRELAELENQDFQDVETDSTARTETPAADTPATTAPLRTVTAPDATHIRAMLNLPADQQVAVVAPHTLPTATEALKTGRMSVTRARTITQLAGMLGRKVQFFEGSHQISEGIYAQGDTLYLNVDGKVDALAVAGHEFTHSLRKTSPELYDKAHAAVVTMLRANGRRAVKYRKYYYGKVEAKGKSAEEVAHELLADIGGNEWRSGEFWTDVFAEVDAQHTPKEARTIITRLRDAIVAFIDKLIRATPKKGFQLEGVGFTRDELKEVRDLVVKAAAEAYLQTERTGGMVATEGGVAQDSSTRSEFGNYPKVQAIGKPRTFLPGSVRLNEDGQWGFVDKKTGDEFSYENAAQARVAMAQMERGVQLSPARAGQALASSVQAADTTGVVVGAKPGAFSWTPQSNTTLWAKWKKGDAYGPLNQGDMPPPFGGPTQRTPNQAIIGEAVFKILKSKGAQAVIKDILAASKVPLTPGQKVEVLPTQGSWLGQPERSFKIVGLTFEQSDVVSKTLGFATAQDMAIVTEPIANPAPDTYVNPGIAIGNGKKFDEGKLKPIIKAAQNEGIDYTIATDGYSVQFGYGSWLPFSESEFIDKVGRIAAATGMTSQAYEARTKANFAGSYRDAIERITGSVQGQGNTDAAAGPSDLFTRTVDNILIPYARAVGGQGYRFSPDLFAERFNLGNAEREYIRSALRPKSGYARSTAKIVSENELAGREPKADEELLVVGKSSGTAKKPVSNNSDVFWALQNRAALTGLIEPGDYSAEAQKLIAQAIEDEIAFHVSRPEGKSAIGWYDAALAKAKKIYHQVFPELDTNPDREMLFDALLGITSQGNDVHANSVFAGRMYYLITRENMTISQAQAALTGTFGEQSKAIENNFLKLEQLLKVNGYDRMRKIFNKQGTVGELNATLRADKDLYYKDEPLEITGLAEQTVRGWMVFGPKIGSFINNLHGDYSTLTADLWFSRTWNRILGFSFLHTPAQEAPKYQAFKEALIAEYEKTTDAKKINDKGVRTEWDHGEDLQHVSAFRMDSYLADPEEMLRIATKIEGLYRTGIDFNGKKTKGYSTKSDLRRAAKNWIEHRYDAVQLPRVDSERAFQQKVMETAQKFMKKRHGITITIADMQAALWYHEKELFNKFGTGDSKSDPADYEDAAKKFMQKYNDGDLFYVEKPTPRYIRGTKSSYAANAPDTGPQFSSTRLEPNATGSGPVRKSTARYGDPSGQHAVSVVGVHYSRQQRGELSSAYFGTGMKGQEGPRVRAASDPHIKQRLYFYANTGKGIAPESDVGTHAHSVQLDNVYDMDVDPLRLYKQPKPGDTYRSPDNRMNDFESAVIDSGFDGYMAREFGKGGAVVLLGTHSVPVQYEGQGVRPDVATTPAPKYSDLQRLKREIAANRALPSGQMTGLEWKRLLMREMPEVDPRWLDNDALYRKGDLLAGAEEVQFSLVRAAEAKKLDAGKKVTLYRAMTLIDGKLYPPMSAKMSDAKGKLVLRNPEPIGQWMRAEERPDLVDDEGKFPLKKPGGGTTWALYAPYFHASPIPLNDQFTAAWKSDGIDRPQLVTVEVEVPESELTSGYRAEGSVKKTGPNKWNSGVVASKVPGGREVMLSRYVKIKRVVPDAEVAKKIAAIVKPNRLSIPENTVTPQLRAELEKQGVRIAPVGTAGDDIRYSNQRLAPNGKPSKLNEQQWLQVRTPKFKAWFGDWEKHARADNPVGSLWSDDSVSKIVDENGEPLVVYHGTKAGGFEVFRPEKGDKHRSPMIFATNDRNTARTYSGRGDEIDLGDPDDGLRIEEDEGVFTIVNKNGGWEDGELYTERWQAEDALGIIRSEYPAQVGIYELFLNIRNPNETNFEGANWDGTQFGMYEVWDNENEEYVYADDGRAVMSEDDAIALAEAQGDSDRFEARQAGDRHETTNSVAETALKYGNDGAIIREVVDDGGKYGSADASDVFVFFDSNQVKSATQNSGAFSRKDNSILRSTTRTDTPAFTKWFGDSVVTNPDGTPKVMYHGTARDISEFRPKQANAIFVTDNPNFASDFAQDSANWISKNEWKPVSGQNVMPLYVRAENPFDMDNPEHLAALEEAVGYKWEGGPGENTIDDVAAGAWKAIESPTVQRYIRANHDSFYVYEGGNKNLAVFEPTQIKSASGNRGTYDAQDPRIDRSTTRTDPWYYSELARAVDNAPAKVFSTGKQVAAWLQSNAGKLSVKKAEIDATGVLDWLATQDKVTQAQVSAYLQQGGVQLTETVLDDGEPVWFVREFGEVLKRDFATEQEAIDWADENAGPTARVVENDERSGSAKFADYQLPGGTGYKEWLLTLPLEVESKRKALKAHQVAMIAKYGKTMWGSSATQEERDLAEQLGDSSNLKTPFKSSHFDQPNILAHIRTNERTSADGKRVLFIEEIQSDWAQKGRKEGFRAPFKDDEVVAYGTEQAVQEFGQRNADLFWHFKVPDNVLQIPKSQYPTLDGARGYVLREKARNGASTPAAPFVADTKSWTALALKRMIAHAAEQGFDAIAWTTGEQQAARYDLSKQIENVTATKESDGTYSVKVLDKAGNKVAPLRMTESELEDNVGKDLAEKISSQPDTKPVTYSGLDLKVGGEGMKGYYDQIVPQVAKKLGATVGVVTINQDHDASNNDQKEWNEGAVRAILRRGGEVYAVEYSNNEENISSEADLDEYLERSDPNAYFLGDKQGSTEQPGFTITPAMQGPLPLFSTRRALDGDFSEQDHLVPDLAPWTTDSQLVDLAYIDSKPVRLNVGVDYGKGEGQGAIHMIANAQRDARRTLDQVTDDEGENVVRTVLTTLGTYGAALHKQGGIRYALRLPLAKMTLVLDSKKDHWSIVTSLPTAENKWGDADWTGRLTFPATEPADGAAPNSIPVLKNPLDGRSGLGTYKSAKFNATPSAGKSQIVVKRTKRVVQESSTRTMGDSGRTYTPEQIAANKRIGREVEDLTRVERIKKWANKRWTQGLFDQFAPVKELSKTAYMLMRLSKGATGAFEAFMKYGKLKVLADGSTDADTTGGFVERVLQPLGKEATDFFYWVAAHRAERLAAEGKERLFTKDDIDAFKSLANGVTDFDYTLRNGQTTRDRTLIYKDALVNFNEFSKNVMDVAQESGLIDGTSRHLWEHEFYVPFYRVMDEKDGGVRGANIKKGVVRQQAFKKLKGGEEKLNDLLDNTLMNFAHLIDASAKNRAAKAALEAAVAVGVAQPVSAHAAPKGSVWYVENGAQKWYSVDDPHLLTAISSLEYVGLRGPMWDALTTSKHWLTVGVTASPFFKVRNLIRDSVHSIGVSSLGYNVGSNLKQGGSATNFTGALKNAGKAALGMRTDTLVMSQDYVSALAGGGLIRFGTMLEGNEVARTRKLVELGNPAATILNSHSKVQAFYNKLDSAWSAYQELGNQGEEINRMALYNQLIKQGKSHLEASFLARDLMDFSSQGTFDSIRILTQVVPFMNARLQGMYKLGRAAKEDPAKMAIVTGAIAVASLSLLAAFGDDDDWKKRPDWDRDTYWWFKFGGEAYRVPKPFELGAIGTLAERSAELLFDKEMTGKRFKDAVVGLLKGQLAMNPTPQALKPLWDLYANKDSFSGKPIEGMAMERLDPQHRYTSSTSMVARGASTAVGGLLSPVQVDHLVRGYFGWIGSTAVATADLAVRAASNEPARPTADWVKIATGGMVADLDSSGSRYVEHMYEQAKEIDQAYGTWRRLLKEGKAQEARDYFEDNKSLIVKEKQVSAIKRRESAISEAIRLVERSNRTPDEKRDAINRYRKMQDQTARQLTP